jgi:hypothetical protein
MFKIRWPFALLLLSPAAVGAQPGSMQRPSAAMERSSPAQPGLAQGSAMPAGRTWKDYRSLYMQGCLAGDKASKPGQKPYCECSFNALSKRYTLEQYGLLDTLIRRGGLPVSNFARAAWEPEFAACRLPAK